MSNEELYVYITYGEIEEAHVSNSLDDMLCYAHDHVTQYLVDHRRHEDGFEVTEEVAKDFDVKIYKVGETVDLPYQEWVDEFYAERRNWKVEDQNRDYEQYLRLKAKFEREDPEPLLVWGGNMKVKSSGDVVHVQLWREEGKIVARLAGNAEERGYSPDAFEHIEE